MKKIKIEKIDNNWIVKIEDKKDMEFRFESQAILGLVYFFEEISGLKGITLEPMNFNRYGYELEEGHIKR